jgi:putative ABC transport system permease protein
MNYFRFAFRNLRKKGIRSWLTLLGIFIGILAVVSLITLGNAMKVAITSQFGEGNTEVITIQAGGLQYGPPGSFVTNPLTTEDVEAINRISSVEFAVGRNIKTGKLEYNNILEIGSAISVPEGYEKEVYEILDDIEPEYGRLLEPGDSGKVVLGYNFHDRETNGFGKDIVPGRMVLINDKKFEVVGILKKKGSLLYDWTVFMYEDELNDLIGNDKDTVDMIEAKVKSKDLMGRAEEEIEKLMRQRRNVDAGEEDFSVTTPEATLETVNSVLGAIQAFIIIIASISILVGSIGIVNTMTTSVLERKKEIGIMKSIGARNSQIFSQFFIESGFLGLTGGVFGAFFGVLIGYAGTLAINNWLGSSIGFQVDYTLILFTLIGSFLIGAVAGITPAMQAAKQNPVEALRG